MERGRIEAPWRGEEGEWNHGASGSVTSGCVIKHAQDSRAATPANLSDATGQGQACARGESARPAIVPPGCRVQIDTSFARAVAKRADEKETINQLAVCWIMGDREFPYFPGDRAVREQSNIRLAFQSPASRANAVANDDRPEFPLRAWDKLAPGDRAAIIAAAGRRPTIRA